MYNTANTNKIHFPLTGTELLVWYGDEYARDLGLVRDKNLLFRAEYIRGEGRNYHSIQSIGNMHMTISNRVIAIF